MGKKGQFLMGELPTFPFARCSCASEFVQSLFEMLYDDK